MKSFKKSQSGQVIRGTLLIASTLSLVGLRSSLALSEPLQNAVYRMLKGVFGVVTTVVGSFMGVTPLTSVFYEVHRPTVVAAQHVLQPAKEQSMMTLVSGNASAKYLHRYEYVFSGKATHDGKACPMASVLVRINSSEAAQTKGTITDSEGNYEIAFDVYAKQYEPIHWSIESRTASSDIVRVSGQRISMQDEGPVLLDRPLMFARLDPDMAFTNPTLRESSEDLQ